MKTKVLVFSMFLAILASPTLSFSQLKDYTRQWKTVDSLADIGLPKSALEVVDRIYASASADDPQRIKAVIYRIRLNSMFREDFLAGTITELRSEIKASTWANRQIFQSILAEVYWKYYQNNLWKFMGRSRMAKPDPDSVSTWDADALAKAVFKNYLGSVENAKLLQSIPLSTYRAIIEIPGTDGGIRPMRKKQAGSDGSSLSDETEKALKLRPTLYDFLAQRAIEFFTADEGPLYRPANEFNPDKPDYFAAPRTFAQIQLPPVNEVSGTLEAVKLYRDLEAFHLADKDPSALLDVAIDRLDFVRKNSGLTARDSLWMKTMEEMETSFRTFPAGTSVSFSLASFSYGVDTYGSPSDRSLSVKAADLCEQAVKRFPDSDGARNCRLLLRSIRNPELEIRSEEEILPMRASLALLTFRNLGKVYFRAYKGDAIEWNLKQMTTSGKDLRNYIFSLEIAGRWEQALPRYRDFIARSAEISMPPRDPGFYIIAVSTDSSFSAGNEMTAWYPVTVTSYNYLTHRNQDASVSVFVFNRDNGMPAGGVTVEAWKRFYSNGIQGWQNERMATYKTDNGGFVTLPAAESGGRAYQLFIRVIWADDILVGKDLNIFPFRKPQERTSRQTTFFTDRGIYRPGQTIWFKGIMTEKKGEETRLITGENSRVVFTDANGRKVADLNLTTNEFGSFNGSFTAPSEVLTGTMNISNENGSVQVSVEEYKRPTFEIRFEALEGSYRLGEMIHLKGTAAAYAGNMIPGAKVNYHITRQARYPFWDRWYIPFPETKVTEIASGTSTTDENGSFEIVFRAMADASVPVENKPLFNFTVSADVTDVSGETHSVEETVSVGYQSLLLSADLPSMLNLSTDSAAVVSLTNFNGRPVKGTVSARITRLKAPEFPFVRKYWPLADTVLVRPQDYRLMFPGFAYGNESDTARWTVSDTLCDIRLNTATDTVLNLKNPEWKTEPGVYCLLLSVADPFGGKVILRKYFSMLDPSSVKLPGSPACLFVPLKKKALPGESAKFMIGSAEKNVNVLYEVRLHDSLVSRQWLGISGFQFPVEVPVTEAYRGNISVSFVFAKNNRIYNNTSVVEVPWPEKHLDITCETFRSKVRPGDKEEWRLRITDASCKGRDPGKPGSCIVPSEVLLGMYDASLDAFRANEWSFSVVRKYFGASPWTSSWQDPVSSASMTGRLPEGNYSHNVYPYLNWFGLNYFSSRPMGLMMKSGRVNSDVMEMTVEAPNAGQMTLNETMPSIDGTAPVSLPDSSGGKGGEAKKNQIMQPRKDFRETAFFMPALRTDSTGSVILSFTVPDALTRWNFMGFAHSRDLYYGSLLKEVVSQKELMVVPNSPRFVRQGDRLQFTARVVNLSNAEIRAKVRLSLADGISLKPADSLISGSREQDVVIPKGGTAAVSWEIGIPLDPALQILQYRVVADAGQFSDGEENLVPVLSNRMMVTETLPLPVNGKGSKDFTLDKLLSSSADKSKKNYRLTLEFASNPAWYAVQALPSLNERDYNDAYSVFGALYSNELGAWILNSDPKIRSVFESWKKLTPASLSSNLEKNQELKAVLLQQTPWVAEAASESDNKARLGLYFDPQALSANLNTNLEKLRRLQGPAGGFCWFEGMPASRGITQDIIAGIGRIGRMTGQQGKANDEHMGALRQVAGNAVSYIDREFTVNYREMLAKHKESVRDNLLYWTEIQYLYSRSFFLADVPPAGSLADPLNFYLTQSVKYWMQSSLPEQAMLAVALKRFGAGGSTQVKDKDKLLETASLIIRSLGERALHSHEFGMYWAVAETRFSRISDIGTQAALIEAFDEVAADQKSVEEMKMWLLKQKQTTTWETSRATTDACYALLMKGAGLLTTEPGVKISLGSLKVDPAKMTDLKTEAGTGYFKLNWSGKEINPEMGKVKVTKSTPGVAWGALYWQYFEDLDKITPAVSPLKLEKKLFLSKNTPSGPVIEQLGEGASLKVGDKLTVRVVLKVDRDLSFVHLRDMRASAFEPVLQFVSSPGSTPSSSGNNLSGYRYQDGLGYYQTMTDASADFFFDYVPKGTYVFEYSLVVNAAGEYSNGITSVQCMYAPEFAAHSEGIRVSIVR